MNKIEAAEFLEIGVRSLERYMAQSKVAYTRQRGKTGETVDFQVGELERFKEELHKPIHQAAIELRQDSPSGSSGMLASSQTLASLGESLQNISEGIDAVVEALKEVADPKVPVQSKPLLTLGEAQLFSGLSRQFLLSAIKEGRLPGQKIGKAWRVKRRDLERFVSGLF